MTAHVFDTSALLALLRDEVGADVVVDKLEAGDGVISAVNAAEVWTKLSDWGIRAEHAHDAFTSLKLDIITFTAQHAQTCGHLRASTRPHGLSLGDRACLALARHTDGAVVVTADRAWKRLKGFDFVFIR